MTDAETLKVYDAKVADYAKLTERNTVDGDLQRFMDHLKPGAKVLDLGCGPGAASVELRKNGFLPIAVDASPGMVQLANETHDLGARIATFDDIEGVDLYDGVWANFSLLHAPRAKMTAYLSALQTALKPDGIFHIGMKLGEGERRDKLGRFYTFYSRDELTGLLERAGFEPLAFSHGEDLGLSGDVEPWITIMSRKAG